MGLFDFLRRREEEEPRQLADRLVLDDDVEIDDDGDDDDDIEHAKSAPADRDERGPFDVSEANPAKRYVDLGAIRIPAREGLGLRLEVEERSKRLVAVALDYQGSTMQVQAFAAPRSSGLWHAIREQIAEQVTKQGGAAEEHEGDLGPVLDTKLPVVRGAGATQHRSARFIGVDGPRWFLRGVLTGEALRDEAMRDAMEELFRSIVVVRGDEAMPPRELLPLVVPKAMADHMADGAQAASQNRAQDDTPAAAGSVESAAATPSDAVADAAEVSTSKRAERVARPARKNSSGRRARRGE